jgi:hypothetical protein
MFLRFGIRAHFRRSAPETGLSACIFFACGKKGYRFYPLRGPKTGIHAGFRPWILPQAKSIYPPSADGTSAPRAALLGLKSSRLHSVRWILLCAGRVLHRLAGQPLTGCFTAPHAGP